MFSEIHRASALVANSPRMFHGNHQRPAQVHSAARRLLLGNRWGRGSREIVYRAFGWFYPLQRLCKKKLATFGSVKKGLSFVSKFRYNKRCLHVVWLNLDLSYKHSIWLTCHPFRNQFDWRAIQSAIRLIDRAVANDVVSLRLRPAHWSQLKEIPAAYKFNLVKNTKKWV